LRLKTFFPPQTLQVSELFELSTHSQKNSKSHAANHAEVTLKLKGSTLFVNGTVDFENANGMYKEGKRLVDSLTSAVITVDLAHLVQSHTVLLAIIVQWVRGLRSEQKIHLENVPPKMRSIISASRLQDVLY
jgi:ABC-type transporter Mla MlaB component